MTTFTLRDASPSDLYGRKTTLFGCGTVGSRVARHLAHWGAPHLVLVDFDIVEHKNVLGHSAQVYRDSHDGTPKVDALAEILTEINPSIHVTRENRKIESVETLSGIVFAGLDQYDGRVYVRDSCMQEKSDVSLLIEGRLGEKDGRVFVLDPRNFLHQDQYLDEMNWKKWVEPDPALVCGGTQTHALLAEQAAIVMMLGLWKWLLKERGSKEPVANDTVFTVEPVPMSEGIVWSREAEVEVSDTVSQGK